MKTLVLPFISISRVPDPDWVIWVETQTKFDHPVPNCILTCRLVVVPESAPFTTLTVKPTRWPFVRTTLWGVRQISGSGRTGIALAD